MADASQEMPAISPGAKKAMLGGLVLCFGLQTVLVYSDEPSDVQLQGPALEGARVWHDNGCQVCHQFYGFGGFLGPDLTNVASRFGDRLGERVRQVTIEGSGQMPAFDIEPAEVEALTAFLVEMNRTGRGQARSVALAVGPGPFEQAVTEALGNPGPGSVAAGFSIVRARPCLACHAAFAASAVGAPPLAEVAERLGPALLDQRLREGKAPGMPAPTPPFSDQERADVAAFLGWLGENRDGLERRTTELSSDREIALSELPWWEYE